MSMRQAMDIAVSAMEAQAARIHTISSNVANHHTTRTPEGGPYVRRDVVFRATPQGSSFSKILDGKVRGVQVDDMVLDPSPPLELYQPGHPDADELGYVDYPNIQLEVEFVNFRQALLSYQSALAISRSMRGMFDSALQILG